MARVRRIVVSQIEGGYSGNSNKRPNGEIGLYDDDDGGFDLVIHDGVNDTGDNRVFGKGKFYGHNGSVKLKPSSSSNVEWTFNTEGDLVLPQSGDIKDFSGNSVLSGGLIETTYSELRTTIDNEELNPGKFYKITDYKTCYDQPNFDYNKNAILTGNYKVGETHSVIVMAISATALSVDAYQPDFPKDKIKYDVSFDLTEVTSGPAFGRITERVDDRNNRTDFDHREVKFVRYPFWTWDRYSIQPGTVSVSGVSNDSRTMTGVDTNFNIFSAGDVIAIPDLNGIFFSVKSVASDTEMTIYSDLLGSISTTIDLNFYSVTFQGNVSHYQTPLMGETELYSSSEHTLFAETDAFNNYFGDVANNVINYENETFILPNNVFLNSVKNNSFGKDCINNTFGSDFTDNTVENGYRGNINKVGGRDNIIGNFFRNNVITGDFRRNNIGNYFEENYIISQTFDDNVIEGYFYNNKFWNNDGYDIEDNYFSKGFSDNQIFVNFNTNKVGNDATNNNLYADFYRNNIGELFYNNNIYNHFYDNNIKNEFHDNTLGQSSNIAGYVFRSNKIGNKFKGNLILGEFNFNDIIDDFTDNEIDHYFNRNKIGSEFLDNNISNNFEFNEIGTQFNFNTVGNHFGNNRIGNNFGGNSVGINFAYNDILNNFYGNTIGDDFGFGGAQERGNRIGNNFQYNTIGEYFYDNIVADRFTYNTIGDDFTSNDIKAQAVSNFNFNSNRGVITSINDNTGASPSVPGTDNTYNGLTASGGIGSNATFNVTVSGSVVTSVVINNGGNLYGFADSLTILGSKFGGTDGQDIIITVTGITDIPAVYTDTNSTIVRDRNGNLKLYYLGSMDFENIGITDSFLP